MEIPSAISIEPATRYRLGDLARLRQRVTHAARVAGLNADRVAGLTLAVDEVVTNAIRYAAGSALVVVGLAKDGLVVQVTDEGPGIPAAVTEQRAAPGPEVTGGRGLWLVRRLCDRVDIRTGSAGTRIRLMMLVSAPDGVGTA